jgi:hypothetical protein
MKKIIYGFVLVVVLIVGLFFGFMDTLTKAVAEKYASNLFKTEVVIKEIDTSLLNFTTTINKITVSNPQGFESKKAFFLNKAYLEIGETEGVVEIKKLNFDGLSLELSNKNERVNLYELYNNLTKGHKSKSKDRKKTTQKESKEPEVKIIITELKFTNMSVAVNSKSLKKTLKINDVVVRNFGEKEGGIPVSQIAPKLMKFVLDKIEQRIKKEGNDAIKKEFNKQVESITEKAKTFFKGLGF